MTASSTVRRETVIAQLAGVAPSAVLSSPQCFRISAILSVYCIRDCQWILTLDLVKRGSGAGSALAQARVKGRIAFLVKRDENPQSVFWVDPSISFVTS